MKTMLNLAFEIKKSNQKMILHKNIDKRDLQRL